VWCCLCDPTFCRFSRTPTCDRRTRTDRHRPMASTADAYHRAVKITPNLLFEYQCTSGKFIRLPNRIEKIDSVARIESNRIETFLPELECSIAEPVQNRHQADYKSSRLSVTRSSCHMVNSSQARTEKKSAAVITCAPRCRKSHNGT